MYIRAAAFSPDGRYLAIAVPEYLIQIWEVATWTKRYEFKGIQRSIDHADLWAGRAALYGKPGHNRAGLGHADLRASRVP